MVESRTAHTLDRVWAGGVFWVLVTMVVLGVVVCLLFGFLFVCFFRDGIITLLYVRIVWNIVLFEGGVLFCSYGWEWCAGLYMLGYRGFSMNDDADLIIDSREHGRIKPCKNYFREHGLKARSKRLDYGDYVFADRVCFEFKTWADFLSSMNDKSLFEEVYNQADRYDFSYLIVQGDRDEEVGRNFYVNPSMRYRFRTVRNYYGFIDSMIEGAVRRCRVVCPVIFVESLDDAWFEMYEQSRKCLSAHKYGGTVRKGGVGVASPVENFLVGIRGFGVKTVERFMETFKPICLKDLVDIGYSELKGAGFNRDKIKNYCLYVHGEYDVQDEEA